MPSTPPTHSMIVAALVTLAALAFAGSADAALLDTATNPPAEPADEQFDEGEPGSADTTVPDEPDAPVPPNSDEEAPDAPSGDDADESDERPGVTAQVRNSGISRGTVALAIGVLVVVAVGSSTVVRRTARHSDHASPGRPVTPNDRPPPRPADIVRPPDSTSVSPATRPTVGVDVATLDLLVDLGEALIDAGDSVGHVEATLRSLGEVFDVDGLGVLLLPTALVISVPGAGNIQTEVGTAGRRPLRLDQIDDVFHLVNATERGERTVAEASAELAQIRASASTHGAGVIVAGHALSSIGIALVLRGSWREVVLAAVLGIAVGVLRHATRGFGRPWQPFWPLLSASLVSVAVFAAARVDDDLAIFPALAAPLVMFLPGALLTTAVLELATGHIVAGTARVASGALQLLLLALGIVAGGRLVGVPSGDIRGAGTGLVAELLPWIGVAVFGVGVVWFNGARRSTLGWILVSMYAAFAGQVLGGLLFGPALSAFFGAAAMTPVALLAARQPSGPTPLVTFLPGFWILVPGALGLEGVTRIISEDGGGYGSAALVTTMVSMVGISLGILLGLVLAARNPERPWSDAASD